MPSPPTPGTRRVRGGCGRGPCARSTPARSCSTGCTGPSTRNPSRSRVPSASPGGTSSRMPELPEVETIKEDLRGLVVGSEIEGAEVLDPALVEQPSSEEFVRRLEGVRATGARRRAKHLIVQLDSGDSLVFQLKIGGQLLLVPPVEEPRTALMLVLHLGGERRLFLRDQTRFSRARLLNEEELEARLSALGPEPLEEEFEVNGVEYLRETLTSRRAQIKPLLPDQKVVAGIGNIYV